MTSIPVYADDIKWDFSGFGSVIGVKTNEDIAGFRYDFAQGDGAHDSIDWGLQSKLGARLKVDFAEQFSITAQALAKRRGQDDLDPELEWFYASYRPASWIDIRAGRLVMPEMMFSDYRDVGYAQPTITPSSLVYIWGSLAEFEGAQLINRSYPGDGVLTFQLSAGEADEVFWQNSSDQIIPIPGAPPFVPPMVIPATIRVEYDDIVALNVSYEWNDWLFRAVRIENDATWYRTGLPTQYLSNQKFSGFSMQYDDARLLVIAEMIDRADLAKAHYLLLGWRFGKWLPSVTFSESEVIDMRTGQEFDYDSLMVALRYDITKHMAAKLQWEETPAATIRSTTVWLDAYPGFSGDRDVISFGLDFTF